MRFSSTIVARMADLGWSQRDLAQRLGVTQARVSEIVQAPDLMESTFARCCDVLGLELDTFQIWRPAPPLSAHERDRVWLASDRCAETGADDLAERLAYFAALEDIGGDRAPFDEVMKRAQKHLYAERIRRAGFDPAMVLGASWAKW